jgi:hypothetical protein
MTERQKVGVREIPLNKLLVRESSLFGVLGRCVSGFTLFRTKKIISGFISLVHYCLSDKVLSIERVTSFARRGG